jgi:hypothetical protein
MSSLPPERDLPEAAGTAVRARVVAAVAAPPDRPRRWLPAAAAAGLAAVVAASIAGVAATRDDDTAAGPSATATAGPSATATTSPAPAPQPPPADSVLLRGCRAHVTALDPKRDPGPLRRVAQFVDGFGIMLVAEDADTGDHFCTFHPDGTDADPGDDWIDNALGFLASGGPDPVSMYSRLGTLTAHSGHPALGTREIVGRAARGVAKVVVTFDGRPPLTVVPSAGAFVARTVVSPGQSYPRYPTVTVVAYGPGGAVIGQKQINPPLSRFPAPSPPAGTADPAALAAACIPAGTLRSAFRDQYGYLLWVARPNFAQLCVFDPSGKRVDSGGGGGPLDKAEYLPGDAGVPVSASAWGNSSLTDASGSTRDVRYASGTVARGVTTLVIVWNGADPVRVPVTGPLWVARGILPTGNNATITPATIYAYDRDGNSMGQSGISG